MKSAKFYRFDTGQNISVWLCRIDFKLAVGIKLNGFLVATELTLN